MRASRTGERDYAAAVAMMNFLAVQVDDVDGGLAQLVGIASRIAVEDDEVSPLAGLDRADLVGEAEGAGAFEREQPQRLGEVIRCSGSMCRPQYPRRCEAAPDAEQRVGLLGLPAESHVGAGGRDHALVEHGAQRQPAAVIAVAEQHRHVVADEVVQERGLQHRDHPGLPPRRDVIGRAEDVAEVLDAHRPVPRGSPSRDRGQRLVLAGCRWCGSPAAPRPRGRRRGRPGAPGRRG